MAENSKIEWTDHTFNAWVGCQKVSPACDHCYAEAWAKRSGLVEWGPHGARRRTSEANWREPLKWNAKAAAAGRVESVFSLSLADIWDPAAHPVWRFDLFGLMDRTPSLLWLLLSKRIGNAVRMCGERGLPKNAALGATMVTQEEWDRDAAKLAEAKRILRPRFTFASVEPMLGPLDVSKNAPDWIICGGESGPGARAMDPAWARSLRDQCKAAGVSFFMKQMTKKAPIPADLLVRESPMASGSFVAGLAPATGHETQHKTP